MCKTPNSVCSQGANNLCQCSPKERNGREYCYDSKQKACVDYADVCLADVVRSEGIVDHFRVSNIEAHAALKDKQMRG